MEALGISSVDDTWVKLRDSIKAFAEEKVGILETRRKNPGLIRYAWNYLIKENRQNYFCDKIQMTKLQNILVILGSGAVKRSFYLSEKSFKN